jgi:L-gulonolactone oxidase
VSESWSNWAGDQSCTPLQHAHPRSTQELVEVVSGAAGARRRVKVAGSGHSFTECALTDGLMVHLDALDRALDCDGELVKVQAGIVLGRLNEVLAEHGRAMENLGDIDKQTLAGAISTATHGTGALLPNIAAQLAAIELVSGEGKVVELTAESDPDGLRAARVGLGALGALSAVTLRTVPAFNLHRVDEVRAIDDVLAGFEHDIAANDHYEFFVFPYARNACTVRRNRTDAPASRAAPTAGQRVGHGYLADGLLRGAQRLPDPRVNRVAAPLMSEGDTSGRVFACSPASAASASPRWSTRCRASTVGDGAQGARLGGAAPLPDSVPLGVAWWPPTTPS